MAAAITTAKPSLLSSPDEKCLISYL
jgi:hypothetical protein